MDVITSINSQPNEHLRTKFEHALNVVRGSIRVLGLDKLAFSFNGGKDSTAILHIIRAALATSIGEAPGGDKPGLGGIVSFFFDRDDDFDELRSFVKQADEELDLQVRHLSGPFQKGLATFLAETGVQGILLGTRRGDPNAGLQEFFCPSSDDWPAFMRINPILDWSYHDVWGFLRCTGAAYCKLYDQGFTSLGSTANTSPNSALQKEDGTFAPAWKLADARLERAGRQTMARQPSLSPALTHSAALVVIGDELLSGKVTDVNVPFLTRQLRTIGWQVVQVVMVPDDVAAIARAVKPLADACDLVITSGGLGPTLDDVTVEGIAAAFQRSVDRSEKLEGQIRDYFQGMVTKAHLKMAEVPEGVTELVQYSLANGQPSPFPVLRCRNVFILPGVPHLLREKWVAIRDVLLKEAAAPPFHNMVVRLALSDETVIADALQLVSEQQGSQLSIGSYPVEEQKDGAGILVTLESKDQAVVEAGKQLLLQQLPQDAVLWVEAEVGSLDGCTPAGLQRSGHAC